MALALAGVPASARAGILASGYLGSSDAQRMGCRVFNAGHSAVTTTSAKVLLESGTPFTEYQNCTQKPLQPGTSCSFTGSGDSMAGIITGDGGTRRLRGVCRLLDSGNVLLGSTEMR
jgi:hypothetical protein